jgi:hypothetical protein
VPASLHCSIGVPCCFGSLSFIWNSCAVSSYKLSETALLLGAIAAIAALAELHACDS